MIYSVFSVKVTFGFVIIPHVDKISHVVVAGHILFFRPLIRTWNRAHPAFFTSVENIPILRIFSFLLIRCHSWLKRRDSGEKCIVVNNTAANIVLKMHRSSDLSVRGRRRVEYDIIRKADYFLIVQEFTQIDNLCKILTECYFAKFSKLLRILVPMNFPEATCPEKE